jgi:hypothetical protein
MNHLKNSLGVVVKPPDNRRIQFIDEVQRFQALCNSVKMLTAILTKILKYRRKLFSKPGASFVFAIQYSQRITHKPPLAITAKLVHMLGKEANEAFFVMMPAFGASDTVQANNKPLKSQRLIDTDKQRDNLCIQSR